MLKSNVDVLIFVQSVISVRRSGAYRIATELRQAGYSCQIIEAVWYFNQQEITKILNHCVGPNTKLVAWSTPYSADPGFDQNFVGIKETLPVFDNTQEIIEQISQQWPRAKFGAGGPSAFRMESVPGMNIMFYGMADRAVVETVRWLENRNAFFQYSINERGLCIVDGDAYNTAWNFNDSQIIYQPEDNIFDNESLTIEVARGCIFQCDFCAWKLTGKRSNEYIKVKSVLREEFIRNWEQHGITRYLFADDTYNDNIVKLTAVAEVVQSLPFELQASTYLRIDLLRAHPEQYSLLKDAGLVGAVFGIESLNHASLKSIGKGLKPERVIEELHKFQELMPNTGATGSFIIGLPFETIETAEHTMSLLADPDFPLDQILMNPLALNYGQWNQSKFEKDSERYFQTDNNRPGWWHNGNFDQQWAQQRVAQFHQDVAQRQRIGGFQTTCFQNLGHSRSIIKQPRFQIDTGHDLQSQRLNQYKSKLFDNISGI